MPPPARTQEASPAEAPPDPRAEVQRLELLALIHDGPLQLLLVALQELDVPDETARERGRLLVEHAARDLRAALDPSGASAGAASTQQELEDWCALSCARTGCAWSVAVHSELEAGERLLLSAARELVTNATRHAACGHIDVAISRTTTGLALDVCDDGVGFPAGTPLGYGLTTLTRRLALVGGELHRHRPVSGGCCVQVLLPTSGHG